ncbi:MAG: twin-arginine translocation signal domain-containing protein, partial [Candidatus Nanohaloarchaea archaeon]|nr:twin-arginine translocation signal domain-containing protein [Candidatus Nanohaloarchaea archaeon]
MTDDATGNGLDMDRRTFLKSAGALGISATAIDFKSGDEAQIGDITYNPKEEVPYVAGWKNH